MNAKTAISRMNEPKEWMENDWFSCQINFIDPKTNEEDEASFDVNCSSSAWRDKLLILWDNFRKENNLPENCVADAWSTVAG